MKFFAILALASMLAGCASATRGWNEQITITSTPSGAEAIVTGDAQPPQCTTPCVVQVKRNADVTVSITKEGYEPFSLALQKEVASTGAAGFAGNLLLGGVVGMAVDGVSGAAMDHKPNPVIATLTPVARPAPPPRSKPRRKPPAPSS
jgi:hypothetical protein